MLGQRLERGALQGAPRQRVLDDLVARLRAAHLTPKLGDLRNFESLVVDEDRALGAFERLLEIGEFFLLASSGNSHF